MHRRSQCLADRILNGGQEFAALAGEPAFAYLNQNVRHIAPPEHPPIVEIPASVSDAAAVTIRMFRRLARPCRSWSRC